MPIYDYLCPACGPFEARRSMSESMLPGSCAVCETPSPRMVSAPRLNLMSSANRYAETRNEKSAHEPDVVHTLAPHKHAPSHSHSHAHSNENGHAKRRKYAGHDASRPWMLGH